MICVSSTGTLIPIGYSYKISNNAHEKCVPLNRRMSVSSWYYWPKNLTCVLDPGGLEVRGHGDRQASTVHLLPSDHCRNHRNSHGRAAYIRICGPRPNNRDLSREMRIRGADFLLDSIISLGNKSYGTLLHREELCVEYVQAKTIIWL